MPAEQDRPRDRVDPAAGPVGAARALDERDPHRSERKRAIRAAGPPAHQPCPHSSQDPSHHLPQEMAPSLNQPCPLPLFAPSREPLPNRPMDSKGQADHQPIVEEEEGGRDGLAATRTRDLLLRRQSLYPPELQARPFTRRIVTANRYRNQPAYYAPSKIRVRRRRRARRQCRRAFRPV